MQDKNAKKQNKNCMYLVVSTLHVFQGKTLSLNMEELQQGLKHSSKKPNIYSIYKRYTDLIK